MSKNLKVILKSIFLLAIFAFAVHSFADWQAPPTNTVAPNNNIPPPVNTGGSPQMKSGSFGALGIRAVLNPQGAGGIGLFDYQVGIGSDSPGQPHIPSEPLDVLGNVKFSGALMPAGSAGAANDVLKSQGPGLPPVWGTSSGGGPWTRSSVAPYNIFQTDLSDKVGIGLNNPSRQLEITESFEFPTTTSSSTGVIYKGSSSFLHDKGSNATFVGLSAGGAFNNTGNFNTGIGGGALFSVTSGYENTAVGGNTLNTTTTGYQNVAVGQGALNENTSGNENIAIGKSSLDQNISGSENIGIGKNALGSTINVSATKNVAIGDDAGSKNYNASGNIFIGAEADTCGGSSCGTGNPDWNNNTIIGYQAKVSANPIGTRTNSVAIGYGAITDASNKIRLGNSSITWIGGQVGWTNASDERYKKDIQDIDLGLDFINTLRPVSYKMKTDADTDGLSYGLIAQEVEQALGGRSTKMISRDNSPEGMMSLRYNDLMAPMIKAIQEQQQQIEELKKEIEILKAR
jgi:hypothetical protein